MELIRGKVERRGSGAEATGEELSADVGAILARLSMDLLDDASFPRSGTWARIEAYRSARSLGADPTYTRLESAFLTALSRGSNTMLVELRVRSPLTGNTFLTPDG